MDENPEIHCPDAADWQQWLAEHHASCPRVWLVSYKKHTGVAGVSYEEAIRAALCYGWVDATVRRLDDQRYCRKFAPRLRGSKWSFSNRQRVEALTAAGLMQPAGLAAVAAAKANGNWERALLDHVDAPEPAELTAALEADGEARRFYRRLTKTQQKYLRNHVAAGRKTETRTNRAVRVLNQLREGKVWGS